MRLLALVLLGSACGNPFIVTDSFEPPPGDFASAPDALHDYATGTVFHLDVRAARMFVDMKSVEVVSKNPDLVEVLGQKLDADVISVTLHALAAGTAAIDFLDDRKRPLEERVLEIKLPDEIDLAVDVDTTKGFTIPVIDGDNLLLAEGGSATFQITYKAAGKELKGSGVLVGESTAITVHNPTRAAPDREFVTLIAPPATADGVTIDCKVDGQVIRTLHARIAPLSDIAAVQLDEGELPALKNNGDVFTVWAKAFTVDAAPVFGAPFQWTFDSTPVDGSGELASYTYQGGEHRRLAVGVGDAVQDVTVEAKDGTAAVAPGAPHAGCASTAGTPLALACVLLAFRRRRA